MIEARRRRCAVTGAADGIGRAFALRLAEAGYAVHGIDIDGAASQRTLGELRAAGCEASFTVADLTTEEGIGRVRAGLQVGAPFDLVVHNAGINDVGAFGKSDPERQRALLDVNLRVPMALTAWLLVEGRIAEGGTLVFVSSLSHFVGYPGAAVYAASKDGLAAYARSLSVALAPKGIRVLTVFPGPTRTEHARRHSPDNSRGERRMAPEELAERTFSALESGRRTLIPGASNRLFAVFGRLAPRAADRAMRRAVLDKLPRTTSGIFSAPRSAD